MNEMPCEGTDGNWVTYPVPLSVCSFTLHLIHAGVMFFGRSPARTKMSGLNAIKP